MLTGRVRCPWCCLCGGGVGSHTMEHTAGFRSFLPIGLSMSLSLIYCQCWKDLLGSFIDDNSFMDCLKDGGLPVTEHSSGGASIRISQASWLPGQESSPASPLDFHIQYFIQPSTDTFDTFCVPGFCDKQKRYGRRGIPDPVLGKIRKASNSEG